jgi:peptide/nickel transport system permease protein
MLREGEGAAALAEALPRKSRETAWRRFRRHRLALLGLGILTTFFVAAVFAPLIAWHDPFHVDLSRVQEPPSLTFILGTDYTGRDILARLLLAGRVSLSVGLVAAIIASIIGTIIGLASAYAGGWVDNALQRFTELVMTFPSFFAVIILVALVGPSIVNLMVVIGLLGWTGKSRLVRGQVLSLREMDFVTAARAIGSSHRRMMFIHILPSVMGYVAVAGMLTVAGAIITEASLSFLGLGVRVPTPTWGNMMTAAQGLHILKHQPWMWAPPGVVISTTVIAVNFVGDGLRDALDPRTRIE